LALLPATDEKTELDGFAVSDQQSTVSSQQKAG